MSCEPIISDNKEKGGDNLSGNHLINLNILTTDIEILLVFRQCVQEKALQMKSEEERDQENMISYVEAYYRVTPMHKHKGIMQLRHDFN